MLSLQIIAKNILLQLFSYFLMRVTSSATISTRETKALVMADSTDARSMKSLFQMCNLLLYIYEQFNSQPHLSLHHMAGQLTIISIKLPHVLMLNLRVELLSQLKTQPMKLQAPFFCINSSLLRRCRLSRTWPELRDWRVQLRFRGSGKEEALIQHYT